MDVEVITPLFLIIVIFYSLAAYHLRGASDADAKVSRSILWQTLLFPLAYLLSSLVFVVSYMTDEQYYWGSLLGWGLRRSNGAFDAIIYAANPFVRNQIKAIYRRGTTELLLPHP